MGWNFQMHRRDLSCTKLSGFCEAKINLGLASDLTACCWLRTLIIGFQLCTLMYSWLPFLSRICSHAQIFPQKADLCSINRPFFLTIRAVGVLQTEAGFVTFGDLGPIERQQIIVGEHLNAVVVPEDWFRVARLTHGGSKVIKQTEGFRLNLLLFLLLLTNSYWHQPVGEKKQPWCLFEI